MSAVYVDEYLPAVRPLPERLRRATGIDDSVDGDLESIDREPTFLEKLALARAIRARCRQILRLAPRPSRLLS